MFNPYASAKPFFSRTDLPGHVVSEEDQLRLQSYTLYERIYWTVPDTFKIMQRGTDSAPIYLPSARKIIEAVNRFLAVNFGYLVQAEGASEKDAVTALVLSLFKREKFFTKFKTQKRYGLIRGDAMWHITADPKGVVGERISLHELDPSTYFPIPDPEDSTKTIGCHLVDIITDPNDPNKTKKVARRQTYRKEPTGMISSELALYETNKWDDRNLKPADVKLIRVLNPKFDLPPAIKHLPVYSLPNNRIPGLPHFGYSEVLGIERVFAAVNQSVSDEELSLAMAGLGIFWTTAGPPRDASGAIVPWDIGPARMLEVGKDSKVERLQGISSVAPMIDHMNFILGETQSGIGVPDIAAGKVDVTIAESGISLQMQLAPLIAKNAEKEEVLIETYDQLFYDLLHGWFVAYEDVSDTIAGEVVSVTGDAMPKNRKAEIAELLSLKGVLTTEEIRKELRENYGYNIEQSAEGVISEAAARAQAEDPFAQRASDELEGEGETGGTGQQQERNNGAVLPATVAS